MTLSTMTVQAPQSPVRSLLGALSINLVAQAIQQGLLRLAEKSHSSP